MIQIKNIIKKIAVLCTVLACFSCQKQEKDMILVDLTRAPDKLIENTSGSLFYNKDLKRWAVRHSISGTIDSVDIYLIVESHDSMFAFEAGKQVFISGFCYRIPDRILADKKIFYPAGTECYYIKVTNLN